MDARASRWSVRLDILRPWQTNALLICLGFGLLLLTKQLMSEFDHYTIGFSGVSGWSVWLYLAAVALVVTQRVDRYTFGIIVAVAVVCRLVAIPPDPFLSSDAYRYVWDGIVQHAHISPYRYVPGDAALTFLRAPNLDIYDSINRRDYAHTIYPPAAQFLFYLITYISPTIVFMKMAMVLFEGLTIWALVALLKELGFAREQAAIYAWCPLAIWEFSSSGHVDAIAIAFIALALLARYRRQPVLTGLFLGLAVMTKLYPIVLLPALFRRGEYKMPATVLAVIAFGYVCYASVGLRVFGFLGGYVKEEGIETGTRYFLLELVQKLPGLHDLSTTVYMVFVAAVFAALLVWCWRSCCAPVTASGARLRYFDLPTEAGFLVQAFVLALALMLLFSPHYPWYIAWLIPFLVLVPDLTVFVYVCGFFYMCTTALAEGYGPKQFLLNEYVYGAVAMAMVVDVAVRRRGMRRGDDRAGLNRVA